MKKLFYLFLLVVTSLLLLSCEKEEKYPGAYPFDHVVFYGENLITEKDSARVLFLDYNNWNQDLYPMQLWVDNEEIATISSFGYLTAKKEGTVTIHAKVMSIYGEIESRIKYTVRDFLKEYIKGHQNTLKNLGLDKDNDGSVTVSDIKQAEKISEFIDSDMLLVLAPYMPNLKEVSVYADTTSRTLDLSMLKLRKLDIHDKCILYARDETLGLDYSAGTDHREVDYEKYKEIFLNKLILDNTHLEELGIGILPGFPTMDLTPYINLKSINRIGYTTPSWSSMSIILPDNIESVYMRDATFLGNKTYTKLSSLILENCLPLEIRKENFPNLRELYYLVKTTWHYPYIRITSYDISSFEITDIDSIYVIVDTLTLSESIYNNRGLKGTVYGYNYIVKE